MGIYLIPLSVIVAILVIAFLFASLQQVKHKTRYIVLYVIAIVMLFAVIPINEYLIKFTQISSEENLLILIFDIAVGYFCMYIAGLLKFNLLKQKNSSIRKCLDKKATKKSVDALLKHQNEKQKTLLKGELEWFTEKIKVFTEEEQKAILACACAFAEHDLIIAPSISIQQKDTCSQQDLMYFVCSAFFQYGKEA